MHISFYELILREQTVVIGEDVFSIIFFGQKPQHKRLANLVVRNRLKSNLIFGINVVRNWVFISIKRHFIG